MAANGAVLQVIEDEPGAATALARARALVGQQGLLDPSALQARKWVAVPTESASHFDELDATRLAAAMSALGCKSCLVVLLDEIRDARVYRTAATRDALLDFSVRYGHLNALLLAEEGELFAVLCSVDDFLVIAGPEHFVELAVGGDVESAKASFRSLLNDTSWPAATRELLSRIARAYSVG